MKNPLDKLSKPIKKDTADFVQFTRGYLVEMTKLAKISPTAVQILLFLTSRMNKENALVVSYTALQELLNVSRSAIQTGVKHLIKGNWVQVVKVGSSNGYLVNSRVVWRTHNSKRFGYFGADVIVSETEQTQTVEELENQPLKQIPNVKTGENILYGSEDLPPPDQRELIESDANFVPHIKETD